MVAFDRKVALAFGLNIAAGLATCIGGIVIFIRKLVHLANPSSLGIALGLSAGVMIFISLVEIFGESVEQFEQGLSGNNTENPCGNNNICKGHGKMLATVCFFLGAGIVFLMDYIVNKISPDGHHEVTIDELSAVQQARSKPDSEHVSDLTNMATRRKLNRMGVLTALAIGIHNIPEGFATYAGAMDSTKLGVALAIGIALHNIPEGVAVATPVYFATKSKLRAFLLTLVSALAEPVGGCICALIIHVTKTINAKVNMIVYGVIFGLVAGMMVTISVKELIPTAYHFYPSKDKLACCILIGMGVMALSLILMDYAGV